MTVEGDEFIEPCQVAAIIWEGATSAGDTVELVQRDTGALIWPGRTSETSTYLGVNLGPNGVPAPEGFRVARLDAGRLCVYLKEP
jgi:hypothetical protein